MPYTIAIDGPAGAGKSTVARALSRRLGCLYVDTGAMYRALSLFCLRHAIPLHDEEAVSKAVEGVSVSLRPGEDGGQRVELDGEDVSGEIRTQEVGDAASVISCYGAVRTKLLSLQRELGEKHSVVMDGRDIGTRVLPGADLKIYLTASSEVRARRRMRELLEKGEKADYAAVKREVEERDYRDMHREIAPLKRAEDALLLDSSDLTIEGTVDAILALSKG